MKSNRCFAIKRVPGVCSKSSPSKLRRTASEDGRPLPVRSALDIFDLEKRLLGKLLGVSRGEELRNLTEPVVILAHDLTPGETAGWIESMLLGFATKSEVTRVTRRFLLARWSFRRSSGWDEFWLASPAAKRSFWMVTTVG